MTKPKIEHDDEALCLLVKGREIVKERWLRGGWGTHNDQVCSLGAIGDAYCGDPRLLDNNTPSSTDPAFIAAQELSSVIKLSAAAGPGPGNPLVRVMTWNDSDSRRKKHVEAAFTRAINKRRKKLAASKP